METNQIVKLSGGVKQLNELLLLSVEQDIPHNLQIIGPGDFQASVITAVMHDGPDYIMLYTSTGDTDQIFYPNLHRYYAIVLPVETQPGEEAIKLAHSGYYLSECHLGSGSKGMVLHSHEPSFDGTEILQEFINENSDPSTKFFNLQGQDLGFPVFPTGLITRELQSLELQYVSFLGENVTVALDGWGVVEGMVTPVRQEVMHMCKRTPVYPDEETYEKLPGILDELDGIDFHGIEPQFVPEFVELVSLICVLHYLKPAERVTHTSMNAIPITDVVRRLADTPAVISALSSIASKSDDCDVSDIYLSHNVRMTQVNRIQARSVYLHAYLGNTDTGVSSDTVELLYKWAACLWTRSTAAVVEAELTTSLLSDYTLHCTLRAGELSADKVIAAHAADHMRSHFMAV